MTSKAMKGPRSVGDLFDEVKTLLDTIQAADVRVCNDILGDGSDAVDCPAIVYEAHLAALIELEGLLSSRASDIQELRQAFTAAYTSQAELRHARADINGFKPKGA